MSSDIRKFMQVLNEDFTQRDAYGRVDHPEVKYDVDATKVVATLRSYKSQTFTKLAQKIEEITALEAQAAALKEEIKQEAREQIADLFTADDACRTRVIETVSFVIKLTKDPKAATTVKYEKVLSELANHLTPELKTVMETITAKYSTLQAPKAAALSWEQKTQESVELSEGVWDKITGVLAALKAKVMSWGAKYDQKLGALKAQVAVSEAMDTLKAPAVTEWEAPMESSPWAKAAIAEEDNAGMPEEQDNDDAEAEDATLEERLQAEMNKQVNEWDHVGSDFQSPEERNKLRPASKWLTRNGNEIHVWATANGRHVKVLDSTGQDMPIRTPDNLQDAHMLLKQLGCTDISFEGNAKGQMQEGEDGLEMDQEAGLTETPATEEGEDAYPIPSTLSDEELEAFAGHVRNFAKFADINTESGKALVDFGNEVMQELANRASNPMAETTELSEDDEVRFDRAQTEQQVNILANKIKGQFHVSVDTKFNRDGSITVICNGDNLADGNDQNPGVFNVKNFNAIIDADFRGFRAKGWAFTQPVGGTFTIGVPV